LAKESSKAYGFNSDSVLLAIAARTGDVASGKNWSQKIIGADFSYNMF